MALTPSHFQHQAIYRRWRAQTFREIVGQTAVVETLRNAVRLDRLAHAFLFVGPRGTGKTSLARIVAKAANCGHLRDGEPCDECISCRSIREGRALDVVEMDAASNNKVDDMRELLPRVYTAPSDLRRKVFIVDEVQRIKEGWDVLLKTLEEPPDNVIFIFCTTDPGQIRPAVVSRLQRFVFRPLTREEIGSKLERILSAEGRAAEPAAVELLSRLAAGGMRDAEAMLDQVLTMADGPLTAAAVEELLGLASADVVDRFLHALLGGDPLAGIGILDDLETGGRDLTAFADQAVARLRTLLMLRLAGGRAEQGPAGRAAPAELARAARRLTGIDGGRNAVGGYRFQLELALLAGAVGGDEPTTLAAGVAIAALPPSAGPVANRGGQEPSPSAAPPASTIPPAPPPRDVERGPVAASPSGRRAASRTQSAAAGVALTDASSDSPGDESDDHAFALLRQEWREVVQHVGRNPAYRPLIDACSPLEIRDGVVVLAFPEDQAFLRSKAEQKRAIFEEAIEHVLERRYGIRCVTANVAAPVAAGGHADDDLVGHARRIFAGEIMDAPDID